MCVYTRMRGGEVDRGGRPIKCVWRWGGKGGGGIWSRFSFKPSEKSSCSQGDTISGDREKGQRIHVAKETRTSWHSYINFHLYRGRKRKLSEVCVDTLVTDWKRHFFTIGFGIIWFKTKHQTTFEPSNITPHNDRKKPKPSSKGSCAISTQAEISYFQEPKQGFQRSKE